VAAGALPVSDTHLLDRTPVCEYRLFTYGIVIGNFILLFTLIWLIIRCAKGLKQLDNKQTVANIESWLFT
jgi:uncharacterized membrane protein